MYTAAIACVFIRSWIYWKDKSVSYWQVCGFISVGYIARAVVSNPGTSVLLSNLDSILMKLDVLAANLQKD